MDKQSFYNILCKYTPEELNKFISKNGKKKMVNAVTFSKKEEDNDDSKK